MNNSRRMKIIEVVSRLQSIVSTLEDILTEEDDYRDNMPENLQGSARYETSEDSSNRLDSAISSIDEAISTLEDIG